MDPRQEHEGHPRLRLVPSPDGGHDPAVVLTQVLIEEVTRDVRGVHEVLNNRQPGGRATPSLGPKAPSKVG